MTTKIDSQGGVARYLQLYATLSQQLADGIIDPGAIMPSEPSLARKYRVSRTTVRRALERLEGEGKIVRRRGSGTYASARHAGPLKPGQRISQRHGLAHPAGRIAVATRRLDAMFVATPAAVQKSMPGFGASTLMVRTLKLLRGQAFAVATRYFTGPYDGGSSAHRVSPAVIERAARRVREQTATAEQIVTAMAADAFSARQLAVAASVPLLQVRRLFYDRQRSPLEYQDARYRADLFEIRMLILPDGHGDFSVTGNPDITR